GVQVLPLGSGLRDLGDAEAAFQWLGEVGEPIHAADLGGVAGDGATAARDLLARLDGEVLLPLRHRGLLLGVGVIGRGAVPSDRARAFHRAIRGHATVAIANTYLDAEARGRRALAEDMTLANAVQESLMPDERPILRERFSLRGVFRPMAACGGDL